MRSALAGAGLALALLAGCTAPATPSVPVASESASRFQGVELTTPYALPDLTLTDHTGGDCNVRTSSERPVLVFYYGYTNCPDICLGVLTDIASAMDRLSCGEDPASSTPKTSSSTGASEPPKVVQPITPRPEESRGR